MGYKLDDIDPKKTFDKQPPIPFNEFYHLQIESATNDSYTKDDEQKQTIKVNFVIVGARDDPKTLAAIGRKIKETIFLGTARQLVKVGMACGYYTTPYLDGLKERGEDLPEPNLDDWCGLSLVAKVSQGKKDGKPTEYPSIGWDYYPVDAEEVRESKLILNQECLSNRQRMKTQAAEDDQF